MLFWCLEFQFLLLQLHQFANVYLLYILNIPVAVATAYAEIQFLPTLKLVGTDIAHVVPLTLVEGLGHASMGNMDFDILRISIVGFVSRNYLYSLLSGKLPDLLLRNAIAKMLFYVGFKLIA